MIGSELSDLGQGVYNTGSIVVGCISGMAAYDSSGVGALLSIIPVVGKFSNAVACAAGAEIPFTITDTFR